jgi:glycosyltransferase involved in cell wall biosynthesis
MVEKITYLCATQIYPNSFGLKQIILDRRFCSPGKLKVIGNESSIGINTRFFHPNAISEAVKKRVRQKHAIQPEDFVFVFVGRLVKDKGINELVNAFKQIQNKSRVR